MAIDFEYLSEKFTAQHDGDTGLLIIVDCDGDFVLKMYIPAIPSKDFLRMMLNAYNQGYEAGKDRGRSDCQYDIRMALGIKRDGSTL